MRKSLIKTLAITVPILLAVLFPARSFAAGVEKIRHVTSIYADDEGGKLSRPEGVGCADNSYFTIADTGNSRLIRYSLQEEGLKKEADIIIPQLTYPVKVKINSRGEIYALDGKHNRIVRLGPDGTFKNFVEPVGLMSPSAYVPKSFDIDRNDNIYILDILSERVIVLDPEGEYQKQINFPEEYGFFSDIAVDFKGSVLLIDSTNAVLYSTAPDSDAFTPLTGSLRPYMRYPASLTTGIRGRIYLVDKNGSVIVFLGQDGSFLGKHSGMGWKEGLLNYPSQMCINANGVLFIADTQNNRVQIFSLIR